jgi:hypothetical protein
LLAKIFVTPQVVRFPDGQLRKITYRLQPYIADDPEQALIASKESEVHISVESFAPSLTVIFRCPTLTLLRSAAY